MSDLTGNSYTADRVAVMLLRRAVLAPR